MSEYEREVELYDYIEVLLKHKWFILAATLVCGGLGWLSRPEAPPPVYEADAVLMIKNLPTQEAAEGAPATNQSSGFYEALALADDLKQELSDSLRLGLRPRAMDGMLQVAVIDPGVRLTARSGNPDLPVDVVNTWARLFVRRNTYINSKEGGEYYSYIDKQDSTARSRLDSTEKALYEFEKKNSIGFLQFQQSMLDTALTQVYQELFQLQSTLDEKKLELDVLRKRNLVGMEGFTFAAVDGAKSLAANRKAQVALHDEKKRALSHYDSSTGFASLTGRLREAAADSLNLGTAAEVDSLQLEIANLERELSSHPTVFGDNPNPVYVTFSELLVSTRMQYERAKRHLDRSSSPVEPSRVEDLAAIRADHARLSVEREKLTEHYDQQLLQLQQLAELLVRKNHLSVRLDQLEEEIATVKDTLSTKIQDQQRLVRDKSIFEETVGRFSKLAEEARIARERAAGDIGVLTWAMQNRESREAPGQQKAAIAAGVGLLVSSLLSLLIEYVRKAQKRRSGTTGD